MDCEVRDPTVEFFYAGVQTLNNKSFNLNNNKNRKKYENFIKK